MLGLLSGRILSLPAALQNLLPLGTAVAPSHSAYPPYQERTRYQHRRMRGKCALSSRVQKELQARCSAHPFLCSDFAGAPGCGGRERAGAQTAATAGLASSCRRWGSRLARRSWCALCPCGALRRAPFHLMRMLPALSAIGLSSAHPAALQHNFAARHTLAGFLAS